ncbi:MAG: hypothetical protein EOM36_02495 [Bacteroidia bacterium]|nr:hypothetical protein [Bacteroidia bacterium]
MSYSQINNNKLKELLSCPIPPLSSVTKKSRQVPPAVGTNVCGSNILATVTQDNRCYFSPRHVCDALGIDWKTQHRKIMADQVLTATMVEMTTVARDGKSRTMSMLPGSIQHRKIMEDQVLSTCVTEMVMQLPGSIQHRKIMEDQVLASSVTEMVMEDQVLSQGVTEMVTPSAGDDEKTTVVEIPTMRSKASRSRLIRFKLNRCGNHNGCRDGKTCVKEILMHLLHPEGFAQKI